MTTPANTTTVLELSKREPTALDMIQSVIERGVTSENVSALRELVALKRDMDKDEAAMKFAQAFVALQKSLPRIQMKRVVNDKGGNVKFTYANISDIMDQIGSHLVQHGFCVSFSQQLQDKTVTETCFLMHEGGHQREAHFSSRICAGPPGTTEMDWVQSAATRAQRESLADCLNIVRDYSDDPRLKGDDLTPVTLEQAFELERRVKETNSNASAFLKLAGADSFRTIPVSQYGMLDEMLVKKESRGR